MTRIGTTINNSPTIVAVAAAAMPGGRGKAVKFDNNGKIVLCSTAGEVAAGIIILQGDTDIAAGEEVSVQIKDIGMAVAGAAVKVGDPLAADASGKFVKATDGQFIVGYAVSAASAADRMFQMQITKGGYMPAAASPDSEG